MHREGSWESVHTVCGPGVALVERVGEWARRRRLPRRAQVVACDRRGHLCRTHGAQSPHSAPRGGVQSALCVSLTDRRNPKANTSSTPEPSSSRTAPWALVAFRPGVGRSRGRNYNRRSHPCRRRVVGTLRRSDGGRRGTEPPQLSTAAAPVPHVVHQISGASSGRCTVWECTMCGPEQHARRELVGTRGERDDVILAGRGGRVATRGLRGAEVAEFIGEERGAASGAAAVDRAVVPRELPEVALGVAAEEAPAI